MTEQETAQIEIKDLLGIGMTIVVLVIGLAYGLQISGDVRDDVGVTNCAARTDTMTGYNESSQQCYNSTDSTSVGTAEFNATTDGITAIAKIPAKLGMIVTVLMAAVIIGLLVRYLWIQNFS